MSAWQATRPGRSRTPRECAMTLTITVRLRGVPAGFATAAAAGGHATVASPDSGRPGGRQPGGSLARDTGPLGTLLPLAEPAALLLAEAAGLGLLGRVLLATAFRSAQRALAG